MVSGGRVPVASTISVTGVGKVAALDVGDRVGLGYGPWNSQRVRRPCYND